MKRRKPNLSANQGAYVVPLGTSSAIPTLRRGLAATLLVRRNGDIFLFDGGEGTQLRFLATGLSVGRLRRIFVTHLHLDHYGGLFGLIARLCLSNVEQEIDLYGPKGIQRLLQTHIRVALEHAPLTLRIHELDRDFEGVICEEKDFHVETAPLDHVIAARGYRYEEVPRPGVFDGARADRDGIPHGPIRRKLIQGEPIEIGDKVFEPSDYVGEPRPGAIFAYCTDTRPCAGSVRLARGAHLMQHETTYSDEHRELARARGHSTAQEAAHIAKEAGVHTLLAFHFSTRYEEPRIREIVSHARRVHEHIRIAFDLDEVRILPEE